VVIDVLSQDAASIRPGMPARLSLDLGPPRHPARVRQLEPVARTRLSALGVEEQRVKVVLDPEPDSIAQSGDGWRVNASIITLSEDDALIVPNGALLRRGEAWVVLVVESGRSRAQPVIVAARNARTAWIRDGLFAGQSVILYPPAALPDRTRITALQQGR